jgi:hypothetical protein
LTASIKLKKWFQAFAFKSNLYRYVEDSKSMKLAGLVTLHGLVNAGL